ncbi:hypothetical protein LMIY3S_00345 [Labrys miyagiensis]
MPTAGATVSIDTIQPNGTILGVTGAALPIDLSSLVVGDNGTGTLTIQNGSTLSLSQIGTIGNGAGSNGTVIVAGADLDLDAQAGLSVGSGGTGALVVKSGAMVEVGGVLTAGAQATSTGNVTVDGAGSSLSITTSILVGDLGAGSLTIDNGGTAIIGADGVVANGAGAIGVVSVAGEGSTWTIGGDLTVGNDSGASGQVGVSAGGTATIDGALNIATAAGSSGSVTVRGSGSTLSVQGQMAVGVAGTGSLTVEAGGQVDVAEGVTVGGAFGNGVLTVDGNGSQFHSGGALVIGSEGTGSLLVTNGGTVGADSEITIADHGGGSAVVSEAGSTLTTANLNIGGDATGTLTIESGGEAVATEGVTLGVGAGGDGSVTVTGEGSSLTSDGSIVVGQAGSGNLAIAGAGTVDSAGGVIGSVAGGSGSVTISGTGSIWTDTGTMVIGGAGSGAVDIVQGATLRSAGSILGDGASGVGSVQVSGAGSTWTAGGAIIVGNQGTGSLNVTNAGVVIASGGTILAAQSGSSGTLNLTSLGELQTLALTGGSGNAQANFDMGTLTALADNAAFISGFTGTQLDIQAGTLTIDNAGFRITASSPLSGSGGLVSEGRGVLITTADNTYSGGTIVASGTLAVGDAAHADAALSGGGDIDVARGATLGGYGSVTGTVNNDGTIAIADAISAFGGDAKGSFIVNGTLVNNNVALVAGTGVGNTLSVGSYVGGSSSIVVLNTYLGTDGSASDLLVIDGGTATGHSGLAIRNVGGPGAITTGNGILVIDTINGATTASDAFSLASVVAAGAYEYNLFHGGVGEDAGSQDWYLRSVGLNASAQTAVAYPDTLGNFARAIMPAFQQRNSNRVSPECLSAAIRRQGEESWPIECGTGREQGLSPSGEPILQGAGAWGRMGGQYAAYDPKQGSPYRQWLGFMQAGYEGTAFENGDGLARLGVYATIGTSKAVVDLTRDPVTGSARSGRLVTTGYGIGADATWLGNNGVYADLVGQFTWFDSDLSNKRHGNNEGWSAAASLEIGKRFTLAGGWVLVPRARLVYTDVHFDRFMDIYGSSIRLDRGDSLYGEAGLRLERLGGWQDSGGRTRSLLVYGTASLDYAFLSGTRVDVGTTPLAQQNQKLWGEIGIGGYYGWNASWSVYGEADLAFALQRHATGNNYAVRGLAGLRHTW